MGRSSANIRQDGDHVLLTIDGKAFRMPWQTALAMGRALQAKARQAEELVAANRIVADEALLIRAGAGLSLSSNPAIRAQAHRDAQWDSQLRRAIPNPNPRSASVGVPRILQEKPK